MATNFEAPEYLDVFAGGWNDPDFNFDDYQEYNDLDWELWDALQDDPTNTNAALEPSSSATFHTASSPPPRLSQEPRRHAPSSRVNYDAQQEQSNRTATARPSPHHQSSRSPRPAYTQHRADSTSRRRRAERQTSALAGSISRDLTELSEQVEGLQNRLEHISNSLQRPDSRRQRRAPTPTHTQDWLDGTATRASHSHDERRGNLIFSTAASDSDDFGSAIDIDDILTNISSEAEADGMPANTRRQRGGDGVVDLTIDSSPASQPSRSGSRPRKRSAQDSTRGQSSKRRKPNVQPSAAAATYDEDIEQLDLTNEAPSAEEELTAALIAQQSNKTSNDNPSGLLRIGQRNCIICMEPFTNVTITACGHIYCHECLTQALLAGEKNSESGKANCPVCRKEIKRKQKGQVIPLAFMKKSAWKGKARREGG